jgi:hypothetical protein
LRREQLSKCGEIFFSIKVLLDLGASAPADGLKLE